MWQGCKETEFRHGNHGSVLALNTNVCRVQEETREVIFVGEGHDASLRRSGEARDGGLRDDVSCGEARERLMSRRLMSSTLCRFCTLAE